jgi:hypothetical protein
VDCRHRREPDHSCRSPRRHADADDIDKSNADTNPQSNPHTEPQPDSKPHQHCLGHAKRQPNKNAVAVANAITQRHFHTVADRLVDTHAYIVAVDNRDTPPNRHAVSLANRQPLAFGDVDADAVRDRNVHVNADAVRNQNGDSVVPPVVGADGKLNVDVPADTDTDTVVSTHLDADINRHNRCLADTLSHQRRHAFPQRQRHAVVNIHTNADRHPYQRTDTNADWNAQFFTDALANDYAHDPDRNAESFAYSDTAANLARVVDTDNLANADGVGDASPDQHAVGATHSVAHGDSNCSTERHTDGATAKPNAVAADDRNADRHTAMHRRL